VNNNIDLRLGIQLHEDNALKGLHDDLLCFLEATVYLQETGDSTGKGRRERGKYNHNKGAAREINETIFFAFLSTPEKGALLTLH
jgi:hypothetical protein